MVIIHIKYVYSYYNILSDVNAGQNDKNTGEGDWLVFLESLAWLP